MSSTNIRRGNPVGTALLLGGLCAMSYGAAVPASEVVDASVPSEGAELDPATLAALTETTGDGILPAAILAGTIDKNGKVPALNAVAGSAVSNVSVAIPLTVLTHGVSYCYTIALQDYNVTGDYEVEYFILQTVGATTKVVQSQLYFKGKTTSPGEVWVWDLYGKALADSPGPATLVGLVRWGTAYDTQAVVTSKILIK
jgi:hypothetical protein